MPKEAGYGVMFSPEGVIVEHKFSQCGHCGLHFRVDKGVPVEMMGSFCRSCYTPICSKEKCNIKCEPTEKWIETIEQKEYSRIQYNKYMNF